MNEIVKIDVINIDSFKNHPFLVEEDTALFELIDSIKINGLLNPIVVRQKNNRYELISGHRRKHAYELLGYTEIEAIVKDISDDEEIIQMVDSNIYREKILPGEKAFAYKMKMGAIKHQGKTCGTECHKSRDLIGNESGRQIQNYIRHTKLIPELMKLVDNTVKYDKRTQLTMGIKPAVELSYLTKEEQQLVYETIKYNDATPSHAQTIKIRELSKNKQINFDVLEELMSQNKGIQNEKITFNKSKIENALPVELIQRDKRYIEQYIIEAISYYNKHKQEEIF